MRSKGFPNVCCEGCNFLNEKHKRNYFHIKDMQGFINIYVKPAKNT